MMPPLPEPWEGLARPLFDKLPVNAAMSRLVVNGDGRAALTPLVEKIAADPLIADKPELAAGLWLYVDDLHRSHEVSQSVQTPAGSFWHAIMHRREGDFFNSKYWYRRVGSHPVFKRIDASGGSGGAGTDVGSYDPFAFVDHVEHAHRTGDEATELVDMQRREWVVLFTYCAEH